MHICIRGFCQQAFYARGHKCNPTHTVQTARLPTQNLFLHLMNIGTLHFLSLSTTTWHINKTWLDEAGQALPGFSSMSACLQCPPPKGLVGVLCSPFPLCFLLASSLQWHCVQPINYLGNNDFSPGQDSLR